MRLILLPIAASILLAGCTAESGILPVAPGTYSLTEMRAPVRGGGAEARRAVMEEAATFCRQGNRRVQMLDLRPDGDPRIREWPTTFHLLFQCV